MSIFTCKCSAGWVTRRGGLRRWQIAFGEALEEPLRHWHQVFLPMHFTEYAYDRYNESNLESLPTYDASFTGYIPRQVRYTEYKFKKFKHRNPLVFKGVARRDTQAKPNFTHETKQDGKGTEATVTFGIGNADRAGGNDKMIKNTSRRISSNHIRDEFTCIAKVEFSDMQTIADKQLTKLLNERLV